MHGLKSTIGLVVVLAGLVGYIYFVDADRDPNAGEAKAKAFAVTGENIEELEIKQVTGESAKVQKVDDQWVLVDGAKTEADSAVVGSLASSIETLEIQRVVDENPADLTQYGLNPPRLDVSFRAKGETNVQRLLIGEKTPTGSDLYAKTPDQNRVFLISSFLDATFNKTAFDLRDKAILNFDSATVSGIELTNSATTMQMTKRGTEWMLAKPLAVRADYPTIEAVITRMASGQMQAIVVNEAPNLREYGLDKPAITIALSSGSSQARLLIGGSAGGGRLYAKDAARPMVFTIEESLVEDLNNPVDNFRRKDLFDSRSFTINKIELKRGAESFTFEKTTADGKDTWKNASGVAVDTMKVEELLTQLSGLRPLGFETPAPAALRTPALTVNVRYETDKTESITLARDGDRVLGSRADEPGSAPRVEPATFENAMKALDALK